MKWFLALLFCLMLPGCAAAPRQPSDVAIVENVVLIDGLGGVPRPGMSILVENGRISDIYPTGSRPTPDGAERIEAPGRYVTPGLIDSHVHLMTAERPSGMIEGVLRAAMMGGVTVVRDMGGSGPGLQRLSRASASGDIEAPRILYSSLLTGPDSDFWLNEERTAFVAAGSTPGRSAWFRQVGFGDDLDAVMAEVKAFGADAVKLHSGMDAALMTRVSEAARRAGLRVWAHGFVGPAKPSEVAAAASVLSHGDMAAFEGVADPRDPAFRALSYGGRSAAGQAGAPVDGPVAGAVIEALRAHGVALEPTLFVMSRPGEDGQLNPSAVYNAAFARRAFEAGVPIIAGTDAIGGSSPNLHSELQILVARVGLTPLQALTAATAAPARALGIDGDYGTLETGKRADIVFYSADPSADIRNSLTVTAVMRGGRLFRRERSMPTPPLAEGPP